MNGMKFYFILGCFIFLATSCRNENSPKTAAESRSETLQQELTLSPEIKTPSTPYVPEENLSGELIVLSEEDFIARISEVDNPKGFRYKGNSPALVEFYTEWCGPCSRLNPILVDLAQEYKGRVIFYKINAERAGVTSNAFGVQSIPVMFLFKPNKQPVRIDGFRTREELKNAVETVLLSDHS